MTALTFARLNGADVALIPIANHDARAIVDATDAPLVAGRSWSLHEAGYATCTVTRDGSDTKLYMHQLVLLVAAPLTVDHANLNRLDNRRSNLRPATRAQQQQNRGPQSNSRSGLKGVSWHRQHRRWRATIRLDGRHVHLGLFDDPTEAARAYDVAALSAWGEFARTNAVAS